MIKFMSIILFQCQKCHVFYGEYEEHKCEISVLETSAAHPGFPDYSVYENNEIKCNYNGCGHVGSQFPVLNQPAIMSCGESCKCPCCKMLAGQKIYGHTYGYIE